MKRRKLKAERKELVIRIRVTPEQKLLLTEAAKRAGLDVSAWLRALGIREATGQNILPIPTFTVGA